MAVVEIVATRYDRNVRLACLNNIGRSKRPKEYVFVNSLPKNNYGKVLKTELRELDAATRKRS
jgi:long-chain acyl-CoA synthetase